MAKGKDDPVAVLSPETTSLGASRMDTLTAADPLAYGKDPPLAGVAQGSFLIPRAHDGEVPTG